MCCGMCVMMWIGVMDGDLMYMVWNKIIWCGIDANGVQMM